MTPVSIKDHLEPQEQFFASIPTTHFDVDEHLPAHFDWREHIQMNKVEHQMSCGACWAFAAAAAIESAYAIKHQVHIQLSKQELVDCTQATYDSEYRNHGCAGGYPTDAFLYAVKHGVFEEEAYPYKALVRGF